MDEQVKDYYQKKGKHKKKNQEVYTRLFKMVSVGVVDDPINQAYDVISTAALVINLAATFVNTFDYMSQNYGTILDTIEFVTVVFFAIDYVLRIITSNELYPDLNAGKSVVKYIFSFAGIIDLLSFMPYFMPFFFPAGAAVFKMFRVARIMRLFRINAYYDSLNAITDVITSKKQQLLSSVFVIFVLMLASSMCMYSLENKAQPEVFSNAFSGIWWSASTLLTVGYGDIYPVTTAGKIFGIFITCLGVGMVAIPTGIISAGFVEQYTKLKKIGDYAVEEDIHFIKIQLNKKDAWVGKTIREVKLPRGAIIAAVIRGRDTIVPRGDVILAPGDTLIMGAETIKNDRPVNFKEITLLKNHEWVGQEIGELDISRQAYIVMVKRGNQSIVPNGDLVLTEGDRVFIFDKTNKNE